MLIILIIILCFKGGDMRLLNSKTAWVKYYLSENKNKERQQDTRAGDEPSEESWSTPNQMLNLPPSECTEQALFLTKFTITEIERSSWHTNFLF